jgi:NAD(P)-dependent dehydrogenase (short-subunit alcohol dehydrogenase family)
MAAVAFAIERMCSMPGAFNLAGKAALVTGGNGGIGLGIVHGLAQAGARVAIIARNTDKSHAAAKALAIPPTGGWTGYNTPQAEATGGQVGNAAGWGKVFVASTQP